MVGSIFVAKVRAMEMLGHFVASFQGVRFRAREIHWYGSGQVYIICVLWGGVKLLLVGS